MRTFCTIITKDYFPYAIALYRSLVRFNPDETLIVLVIDAEDSLPDNSGFPGIHFLPVKEIHSARGTDLVFSKYAGQQSTDALRWALKPVLIRHLLKKEYTKVIYTDCDIFFFNDYNFLFAELDSHAVVLTPGRTTRNPMQHEPEFLSGFQYGQFNAGFVGAGRDGIPAMEWWADCCAYRVETNFPEGLFVDQKYLDAMPVLFEHTGIIRHKGCNIAFWNQHECRRVTVSGKVLINGEFPVVFVHFTNKYIPELIEGNDPGIYRLFLEYRKVFEQSGTLLENYIPDLPQQKEHSLLIKWKHKLLIRTRIKRFFFRLSQRL